MVETTPMSMCPMAETCKGMMEKPGSGWWMMTPGILFIAPDTGMAYSYCPCRYGNCDAYDD
jgi:hypothetical protein